VWVHDDEGSVALRKHESLIAQALGFEGEQLLVIRRNVFKGVEMPLLLLDLAKRLNPRILGGQAEPTELVLLLFSIV
jgi:hypothetical protein